LDNIWTTFGQHLLKFSQNDSVSLRIVHSNQNNLYTLLSICYTTLLGPAKYPILPESARFCRIPTESRKEANRATFGCAIFCDTAERRKLAFVSDDGAQKTASAPAEADLLQFR